MSAVLSLLAAAQSHLATPPSPMEMPAFLVAVLPFLLPMLPFRPALLSFLVPTLPFRPSIDHAVAVRRCGAPAIA